MGRDRLAEFSGACASTPYQVVWFQPAFPGFPVCWAPAEGDFAHWAPVDSSACGAQEAKAGRRRKTDRRRKEDAALAGEADLDLETLDSQLSAPGAARAAAIASLRGRVPRLAFQARGCRIVQTALEVAGRELPAVVEELHGMVRDAVQCPHANYVVQKVVEVTPPALVNFVVEELRGVAPQVAQHVFGCRILCRLLEHCAPEQIHDIVQEVIQDAAVLSRHRYGNYVVQQIFEHGTAQQKQVVGRTILADVEGLASHRTGSNVVEQALTHCAPDERCALLGSLLADAASFERLASGRYGCYVARVLVKLPGGHGDEARRLLARVAPSLEGSKYGQRVLAEPAAAA